MIPAARRFRADPVSFRYAALTLALSCAFLAAAPGPAAAQEGFGFHGGASIDPDQGYFGLHYISNPLAGNLRVQPAADAGFGNDVTLAAFHVDFASWFELNPRWQLFFGGGPVVNIYRFDVADFGGVSQDGDDTITEAEGGFDTMVGFAHDSGWMFELRIGTNGSPDIRFGVGYTFK